MSELTTIQVFLSELLRPIIREAIKECSTPANNQPQVTSIQSRALPPLSTSQQVKDLTGWPDSTFYAKVREMPTGIVIRRSRRLLFNTEALLNWLNESK